MATRDSITSKEAPSGAGKFPRDGDDTLIDPNEIVGRMRHPLDLGHWQDFDGPAVISEYVAGDMYRAATGLRSILNLLAHDNSEQSAAYSGHALEDVVLLPRSVRTGLHSGAMALAGYMESMLESSQDMGRRRRQLS